jgi:hypothetical protein
MKALITLFAAFLFTGCVLDREPPPDGEDPPEPAALELAYVSGHFGNYWDCPDEAYQPPRAGAAPADADAALVAGPCAEEPCQPILNCETAQITIQIANIGEAPVEGIRVDDLVVLNAAGEAHTSLPVLSVQTPELEVFDGAVGAGETATLRIDFRGLRSVSDLFGQGVFEAPVKIIVEVEAQASEELITAPIHASPAVAT